MSKLNKTFKLNPLYETDGYKVGHKAMLAPGTTKLYGTWIPRKLNYLPKSITKILSIGQQFVVRSLHSSFQENFFDKPIEVAEQFIDDMSKYLGVEYDGKHITDLHKLGYLPIKIKALPEGIATDPNIPHMTFINTVNGYAWLTLFLETHISKLAWRIATAATVAQEYRKVCLEWVTKTDPDNLWLVDWMCHDFHSRGGSTSDSISVGLAHAFSFKGSDTLNTIEAARYYYDEEGVCIGSVNASEHSVTCTGIFYYKDLLESGKLNNEIYHYYSCDLPCDGSIENPDYLAIAEMLNLRDWLKKFPTGILSVVSDTFDLWKLITYIVPRLKDEILARDGKLVIRPDSGDPVDIICGEANKYLDISQYFPKGDILPEYFEDYLLEEVRDKTPHGECGVEEYISLYKINNKYYKATIHNISWNRHDKQFYFIDMFESAKITIEEQVLKPSDKGVIELLWDIFGGTVNAQGYKVLDSHIGAIYGDSINLERQQQIYERLADKGFAATNIVLGVGSYQYIGSITRDSAGYAAKGSWFEVIEQATDDFAKTLPAPVYNRKSYNIYKDPITDDGTKRSLRGMLAVEYVNGEHEEGYVVKQECTPEEEQQGLLQVIYQDSTFYNQTTLTEIRQRLNN
jgi:nicotinamide phosphoribosyltransferase